MHITQAICTGGVKKYSHCQIYARTFLSFDRKAPANPPMSVSPLRQTAQKLK